MGESAHLFVAAQKSFYFTFFRSKTNIIGDNFCFGIDLRNDLLGKLANGNFLLRCNIDLFSNRCRRFCNRDETGGGVFDKIKITGWVNTAQFDFRFPI